VPEYPLLDLATQRPDLGHYVYRFYDSQGVLLYIGSTGNLWHRIGRHAAEREWWAEVAWDRSLVETISTVGCCGKKCALPEHALMQAHEADLIWQLRPVHNIRAVRCDSGRHLMTEDNVYIYPKSGRRTCRACLAENRGNWAVRNPEKARESSRRSSRRYEIFRRQRRFKRSGAAAGQSSLF
jgi:hypothetical protein